MENDMKIRKNNPILDRLKVIFVLLVLLVVLGNLVQYIENKGSSKKESNIELLLQMALEPVGSTMYVWGGGWDDEDKEAGATSTHIGLDTQWENFRKQQDETYDHNTHRWERQNGLDCSGYVGWVIYNIFESKDGEEGYVTTSTDMAKNYADRGWGVYMEHPTEVLPGDIVSMEGHVWISLGTCADGSVLLAHSSPPGVSVCGTLLADGTESMAVKLATEYMTEYHPEWQAMYPNRSVSHAYLENISLMRWNSITMMDANEFQALCAEEVLVRILKTE